MAKYWKWLLLNCIQYCYPLRSFSLPPPINSFGVSFSPNGETLITFGGLNIGRSSLQQRERDWRHLFYSISADGCLFGLPLQFLLLLIHSHLLLEHIVLNLDRNCFYYYNCGVRSSFGKESKLVTYIFIDVIRLLAYSH